MLSFLFADGECDHVPPDLVVKVKKVPRCGDGDVGVDADIACSGSLM